MEENHTYGRQETFVKAQEDRGLMKLKASHQNYKVLSRARQSVISKKCQLTVRERVKNRS